MQPVDEGHVVTDDLWHGLEQMARLDHDLDRLLGIAEKRNARLSRSGLLPTLERARLAVGLHRRDDLLRHLLQIRYLIETDHIPNLDEPLGLAAHMSEQVCDRCWTGHKGRVGRNLLNYIAFSRTAGAKLDQVEIALAEGNEADQ